MGLAAAFQVQAGADKVVFPADYAKGVVYQSIDRAQNKSIIERYINPEAIEAANKGQPLPSGTTITEVNFSAQLDAKGDPMKDANGRFAKSDKINGYRVMAKRSGWGSDYAEDFRNGEWEYQVFRTDKSVNTTANLTSCFDCHKGQVKNDYVFTYDKLAGK
jgi:hypothetical protein